VAQGMFLHKQPTLNTMMMMMMIIIIIIMQITLIKSLA